MSMSSDNGDVMDKGTKTSSADAGDGGVLAMVQSLAASVKGLTEAFAKFDRGDAYEKRDRYKMERDELAAKNKQYEDAMAQHEADKQAAVARVSKKYQLTAALKASGVIRPEPSLRAIGFAEADLDALEDDGHGGLKLDGLLARIKEELPELIVVNHQDPAPKPRPGLPVPPATIGGEPIVDGKIDRSYIDALRASEVKKALGG